VVTDVPGTTRDAIDTLVTKGDKQYVFVDTAGVRRKRSVSAPVEMTSVMQAIRAMERCDVVVVLVDVTESLADQDLSLINLAEERGRAVVIGLNKVDKVDMRPGAQGHRRGARQAHLRAVDPVAKLSAKAGPRHDLAAAWSTARGRRTASGSAPGEVNRFFEEVIRHTRRPRTRARPCACTTSPRWARTRRASPR
jgi:GTP-binding protein